MRGRHGLRDHRDHHGRRDLYHGHHDHHGRRDLYHGHDRHGHRGRHDPYHGHRGLSLIHI